MVKFGNKLESSRKDGILANTDNIYDKRTGEMQETINQKIANVSPADEEDLTKTIDEEGRSVTKFADRSYSPTTFSGKGYKILRKNIQKVSLAVTNITVNSVPSADGYVSFIINGIETHVDLVASTDNTTALVAQKIATKLSETMTEYEVSANASSVTLTRKFGGVASSSSFAANSTGVSCMISDTTKSEIRNLITAIMFNQPNTIYEIRYDFDLNGETIEMPEGCTLKFEGGSLGNGELIGSNTYIQSDVCSIFKLSLFADGTFTNKHSLPEWYGAVGDGKTDCSKQILATFKLPINEVIFSSGIYNISEPINCGAKNLRIFKSATINVVKSMKYAICSEINKLDFIEEISEQRNIYGGGHIKCNNLAEEGIFINMANMTNVFHISIIDCKIGIHSSGKGSVMFAKDIRLTNTSYIPDSIGLKIEGNDSQFKNITPVNFHKGVENSGAGNSYSNIKPWISIKELWEDSIAFDCKANDGIFIDCRCDTLQYAIANSVKYNRSLFLGLSCILNTIVVPESLYKEHPQTLIKYIESADAISLFGVINLGGYNMNVNKTTSFAYVNGEPSSNSIGYMPLKTYGLDKNPYYKNAFGAILNKEETQTSIAFWNGEKWKDANGIDLDLKYSNNIKESNIDESNIGFRYFNNFKERIKTSNSWETINTNVTKFIDEDKWYKALTINTYYNKTVMVKISTRLSESLYLISGRRTEKGLIAYPLYQVGNLKSTYDNLAEFKTQNTSNNNYDIYIKAPTDSVIDIYPYNFNRLPIYNELVDSIPKDATDIITLSPYTEKLPNLPTLAPFYMFNTIYNKICIWNGIKWIDVNGNDYNVKAKGTTSERPASVDEGFEYYDTTLKKKILWNGKSWVNIDGTALA